MLNNAQAYYDGNSQGAIFDWRGHRGVQPVDQGGARRRGHELLDAPRPQRRLPTGSCPMLDRRLPDPIDQQLIFGVLQMLWDRGETSGYVQHLTDRAYDCYAQAPGC